MKNIFIIGQPRTGKSTIAIKLSEELRKKDINTCIIGLDEIRQAFVKSFPNKKVYCYGTETEVDFSFQLIFEEFIKEYIKCFNKKFPNIILIVEGMEIKIEKIVVMFPYDLIVGMGVINEDIKFFTETLKDFAILNNSINKTDWIFKYIENNDEKEIEKIAKRIILNSKKLKKTCNILELDYFHCNGLRTKDYEEEIVNKILKKVINT